MASEDGYRYDVFISYRRNDYWADFVALIARELHGILKASRPQGGGVFLDANRVEYGSDWPSRLAAELSASRLFVPILWNEYFFGEGTWCEAEMSQALGRHARESKSGSARRIIFPIEVLPTEIPRELRTFETLSLHDTANPHMRPRTASAEKLFKRLRPFGQDLIEAASRAPDYDPDGAAMAEDGFRHLFEQQRAPQSRLLGVR
jgi:hypothetical protein